MMEKIKLLYIDDNPDSYTESYLREIYCEQQDIEYRQFHFSPQTITYETLLNDSMIKNANIIVIDSKLFENKDLKAKRLSGEEIKLVLRLYYPYIETIVLSQNKDEKNLGIIPKFSFKILREVEELFKDSEEHYDKVLKPELDEALKRVLISKRIMNEISTTEDMTKVLCEKLQSTIEGHNEYSELSSEKIDEFILEFKKIEASIHEQRNQ